MLNRDGGLSTVSWKAWGSAPIDFGSGITLSRGLREISPGRFTASACHRIDGLGKLTLQAASSHPVVCSDAARGGNSPGALHRGRETFGARLTCSRSEHTSTVRRQNQSAETMRRGGCLQFLCGSRSQSES